MSQKTLDQIRREIDAEFVPPTMSAPSAPPRDARPDIDEDEVALEEFGRRFPRRPTKRSGYIVAAIIGCIIGQLMILGYLTALMRPWRASTPSVTGSSAPAVPVTASEPRTASEGRAVSEPRAVAQPSAVSEPRAMAEGGAARTEAPVMREPSAPADRPTIPDQAAAASRSVPTARPSAPQRDAGGDTTAPLSASSITVPPPAPLDPRPLPPQIASQAPPAAPKQWARPRPSQDWQKSQAEIRFALGEWLARSGRREADALASEAVVILGADGWTAKTHVPIRSSDGVMVIREQRWERGAKGWTILSEGPAARD
jgi:hypothetical protein